jgi:hypothetical protein
MEASSSLKQTLTNLIDAVRFAEHAHELSQKVKDEEDALKIDLTKLDDHSEVLMLQLDSMKNDPETILVELSQQVKGFLETAKEQAENKLQKKVAKRLEDYRGTISSEIDKAQKSLEAYLASDPLPLVENVVEVRRSEEIYEAWSRSACEGGLRYEYTLAAQNSQLLHEPLSLSKLGHELKVPVRFSRAVLSKARVPGFEKLDQYVLAGAETSAGRIHATFEKAGSGATMKMVTSGDKEDGFVGLEYSDQTMTVNVTKDPSLVSYVDLAAVKKAATDLAAGLNELSKNKVALIRLTVDGEEVLEQMNVRLVFQKVVDVMGPIYKGVVKSIPGSPPPGSTGNGLSVEFIKSRLRLLGGDMSKALSDALGVPLS